MKAAGFEVEKTFTFNKISVPGWFVNGRILRRRQVPAFQVKILNSIMTFARILEHVLPWRGLSAIAVGRKPGGEGGGSDR